MSTEQCSERLMLSKWVSSATAALYQARKEHDLAKASRISGLAELQSALGRARDAERIAIRALDNHTKDHGCRDLP